MKKVLWSLCLLAMTSFAWAIKPLEWGIISKDYIYVNGYNSTSTPVRNMDILDINVTSNNQLWILSDKGLFSVQELKDQFKLEEPLETKKINYLGNHSQIYPERKDGGLYLLTKEELWTTKDFANWSWEPVKPEAFLEGTGPHLTQATEMFSLPSGDFYISGFYQNIPGILSYNSSGGHSFHFPSKEQADRLKGSAFVDMCWGTNYSLWMRDKQGMGLWKLSRGEIKFIQDKIGSITADSNGKIYIASTSAIYTVDDKDELIKLLDIGATHLVCDKAGFLWLAPNSGANILIKYDPKTESIFKLFADNCPIEGKINKILVAENNVKYVWTQNGIYIFNDSKPKYENWGIIAAELDSPELFAENYWQGLLKLGDGNYTSVRMDRKVHISNYSNGKWLPAKNYDKASGLFAIGNVFEKNQQIYFANRFGLFKAGPEKIEPANEWDKKQFTNNIKVVTKDSKGLLWFGSGKGLAKYDGTMYTFFNKKNTPSLKNESVNSMCSDMNGNLFVGTSGGLAVYKNEQWQFYDKENGLDGKKIMAVASNSQGQVFAITTNLLDEAKTINIYENGKITVESIPEKIVVSQAVVDKFNNLWISGIAELVCRKANGEYVFYNSKNSPIQEHLVINDIFLFEDELRLIIDIPFIEKNDGLPKTNATSTSSVQAAGFNKEKLKTFVPKEQVLIFYTKLL